ncbi:hypothetical protein LCGC14_1684080, partial [marine sediment metagenome]
MSHKYFDENGEQIMPDGYNELPEKTPLLALGMNQTLKLNEVE